MTASRSDMLGILECSNVIVVGKGYDLLMLVAISFEFV